MMGSELEGIDLERSRCGGVVKLYIWKWWICEEVWVEEKEEMEESNEQAGEDEIKDDKKINLSTLSIEENSLEWWEASSGE